METASTAPPQERRTSHDDAERLFTGKLQHTARAGVKARMSEGLCQASPCIPQALDKGRAGLFRLARESGNRSLSAFIGGFIAPRPLNGSLNLPTARLRSVLVDREDIPGDARPRLARRRGQERRRRDTNSRCDNTVIELKPRRSTRPEADVVC